MANWSAALETYARTKDPRKDIPSGVYLQSDAKTLTIFDGYEKAKYHFLVMREFALASRSRDPFPVTSKDGFSPVGKVPSKDLASLSSLLASPHALEVLKALQASADVVKKMIEDEMMKNEGWVWGVQIGFHAVESMRHVHLHVISSDLISPKLKNKKHYNSFNPTAGFFLHLDEVLEQLEQGQVPKASNSFYEQILKEPLVSIYTLEEYKNIPKLKEHLEVEWAKLGMLARKKRPAEDQKGGPKPKKVSGAS